MRKFLCASLAAVAFVGAGSASAATEPQACSPGVTTNCIFKTEISQGSLDATNSSNFGATLADVFEPFSITFDFLVDEASFGSSSVTTQLNALNDIDFTSVLLDGFAFTPGGVDPADETFFLTLAGPLAIGSHTITVNGVTGSSGDGAFGGNINLSAAPGVPEPSTWAMMLLGFGGMGVAMRRRRTGELMKQVA
jgi:hypothetical protein